LNRRLGADKRDSMIPQNRPIPSRRRHSHHREKLEENEDLVNHQPRCRRQGLRRRPNKKMPSSCSFWCLLRRSWTSNSCSDHSLLSIFLSSPPFVNLTSYTGRSKSGQLGKKSDLERGRLLVQELEANKRTNLSNQSPAERLSLSASTRGWLLSFDSTNLNGAQYVHARASSTSVAGKA